MKNTSKALKPMPDAAYRLMAVAYRISAPFCNVRHQIEFLDLHEGMTVVDYGCGPGRHTIPVARAVTDSGKVFAVDIHPLAIKAIRKKAGKMGLGNIVPVHIDSYRTGIADASIEMVLLIDIIPIVRDPQPLFREVFRMLKENGRAYISHSHLSMIKTRGLVEASGLFRISKCQGHDMMIEPSHGKKDVSSI